jgi:hypothetical protein
MIRSTDFLSWKDPSHWMEAMKGPRWNERVHEENTAYEEALKDAASKEKIRKTANEFRRFQKDHDSQCSFIIEHGITRAKITLQSGNSYMLSWPTQKREILIGDIDVTRNGTIIYTEDISKGGELYRATCMKLGRKLWEFSGRNAHGLASDVAILGDRVYFLEAHGPLQYKWLISVDLETGKDKYVHYNEKRESMSLSLVRGENSCLFLLCEDAGLENLFHVRLNGSIQQLSPKAQYFFPVGCARGSVTPCYFMKRKLTDPWRACGDLLRELRFSKAILSNSIELCSLSCSLIIYREQGVRLFKACTRKKEPREVMKILAEIETHTWPIWHGHTGYTRPLEFTLIMPGRTPIKGQYTINNGIILKPPRENYGGSLIMKEVKSADGESVTWLATWKARTQPKALLMLGYGAYGLTTPFETTRWRPFIEAGFAVAFALVRGGGDHTDVWAQKGRLRGKLQGVEDMEACIRAAQALFKIPPERTCLFGRSAGGFLVGAAVVRNPTGNLFAAVYTEAPYVDVLQTAANGELPLTKFEYNEFGDPAHRPADFEFLLRLSPVSGLGPEGAPGVMVVCRVGLNDRQVFAYESVKWMDALRGTGGNGEKYLCVREGEGHVVRGDEIYQERAEDFLLLCKKLLA